MFARAMFARTLLAAMTAIGVTPAQAHEVVPGASGFLSMLLHPFFALEIVLLMLGLALLAGTDERQRTVLWSGIAVPVGVAIGLFAQVPMLALPGLWWWPMIAGALLGLLLASGIRIGQAGTLVAACIAAATVGLGVPRERPFLSGAIEAWGGVTVALLLLLAVVAVPRAGLRHPAARIATRVAGAWIAAIAILGLSAALR